MLGLGNPPLWRADPEIEYLPVPSRRYVRFGNRIEYNAHSMRSRDFPPRRTDPDERRVLFVGDSVVHGGTATDQAELATTLLETWLADELGCPVVTGNVSANSWGPPNYLAYLKRYGLFDADAVVIVTNSADYADAPTFAPLTRRRPQRTPRLALQELWEKYIPRWIEGRARGRGDDEPDPTPEAIETCLDALRELIEMVRAAGAAVVLAQHLKLSELNDGPEPGHEAIRGVAEACGVEPVQLGPAFARALARGVRPYVDGTHPNRAGQRVMAETLLEPVRAALACAGAERAR